MLEDGSIKDPRVAGRLITLTSVEVSPDLQHAQAFVSIYTEDADVRRDVLAGLSSAAGMLRREIGSRIGLRYSPEIRFSYDASIAYGAKIEGLLKEIADSEPEDPPGKPGTPETPETPE
jgi:ribosome-binding factor A